jgi:thymidylate kinase
MPLIVFEGADKMGKTTLITQLIDKYPHIYGTAFPSDIELPNEEYDKEDVYNIFAHHLRFVFDFQKKQEELMELEVKKKTILLDRYFYSNLAYFAYDYKQVVQVKDVKEIYSFETISTFLLFIQIFKHLYKQNLLQPDLVIYLRKSDIVDPDSFENEIQIQYDNIFKLLNPLDLVEIEPLTVDTFSQVEKTLDKRGYLERK